MRGGGGGDGRGHGGDVAGVDHPGAALARCGAEAAGGGDGGGQGEDILHIGVGAQQRVAGIPAAARPASISAWPRRRAIGESADALLVALTTCATPARAALATTFSSWAGTAGLTEYHRADVGHRGVYGRGHGQVPGGDISAPAAASALAAAVSGSPHQHPHRRVLLAQQPGRLGADLSRGRHKNHNGPPRSRKMSYATHYGDLKMGCQTQKSGTVGTMESEEPGRPRLTVKGERTRAKIVDAAARLIYERGVAGTNLDDVKAAAGVSGSGRTMTSPTRTSWCRRSSAIRLK